MQEAVIDLFGSMLLIPTPPIVSCEWQMYPTNLPLWSLFHELAVNAVYALIAPFLNNRRLTGLIVLLALALWLAIRAYDN
jgi:peptidoglycan/LPS O-acetylase OafA/YrhL